MNDTQLQPKANNFMIPLSIIIAGGLMAGAVFFGNQGTTSNEVSNTAPTDSV